MRQHPLLQDHFLPQPAWDGVRHIYKKLSAEFHVLTNAFDLKIQPQTKIYLDHLIIAIDEVDDCIDSIPEKSKRDAICDSLLNFLVNDSVEWSHSEASPSLAKKVKHLKMSIQQSNASTLFHESARWIFHFTEEKRHTLKQEELLDFVIKEGEATAQLPLSILGITADQNFGLFFTNLCKIMGVADLIFDARKDYKQGLIAFRPNISLYLNLLQHLIKGGWNLFISIPHKFRFLHYCLKFSIALMKD